MEKQKILELINFFNKVSIEEEDVTTEEERANGQLAVVVTYHYEGRAYKTQKLYYINIANTDRISHKRELLNYFGNSAYWLDINKHDWPQGSDESDLNDLVVPDIVSEGDKDFENFILLLGNNDKTGYIQAFTREGESNQYHHNLMNNNHWHDLVNLIKAFISSKGHDIDKKYFSRLVFKWDGDRNTTRERATLTNRAYPSSRAIIAALQKNIQSIQPELMNNELIGLLLDKKQIILQGPPGTGKTRKAKEIAEQICVSQIQASEEDIEQYLHPGMVLKTTKDGYSFEITNIDTSIRIKIKSSGQPHTVPIKNVVNYVNTKSFEDTNLNHNSGYAPYEISMAKKIISNKSKEFIKLVQFHPSYSYEDFVRGISANTNDGTIAYETKNRLLGDLAKKAFDNYNDSKKDPGTLSKEKKTEDLFEDFKESVVELLAENEQCKISKSAYIYDVGEDAFKYTGDNWGTKFRIPYSEILKLYSLNIKERKDIKKQTAVLGSTKQHATYYFNVLEKFREFLNGKDTEPVAPQTVPERKYIIIIDEINRANLSSVLGELIYALEYRGETVDSMYDIDGDRTLILPPNLFIIGTMNTADRSVGHIDYAIRRRFAFVPIPVSEGVIDDVVKDPVTKGKAKELFRSVEALFNGEMLATDFKKEDVQIGHSYFLASSIEQLKLKLDYEIKPILLEYVKDGILNAEAEQEIKKLNVG